jgi:hypothetical protein
MMRERRRVPRRDVQLSIGLMVDGVYAVQRALQLGEGGMLVETPVELRIERQVLITFQVPSGGFVATRAVVRYFQQKGLVGYGVEFTSLDFSVKRQIRNFIASQGLED